MEDSRKERTLVFATADESGYELWYRSCWQIVKNSWEEFREEQPKVVTQSLDIIELIFN